MIINNSTNNYTLSSYNMQQKVGIMHSIRIKTSCNEMSLCSISLQRTRICSWAIKLNVDLIQ